MERLWTRSFILMTLGMFFLFTAFYMLYPTLPLFIKQMGGNESQVGLAMGAFMLTAVFFRPFIGGLLDRFGRRPFIIWGLLVFALSMYLYTLVGGIASLMALRIFHGITWAVTTTAIMTAVVDVIPINRRGEGLGWSGMAMTLAMSIGPMIGLWIAEQLSYQALFLISVVLSVAALLLTFGVKMTFKPKPKTSASKIEFFDRAVLPIMATVFLLFIAYGGITTFVPLFADSIKVNSGTFFLVYAATLILIRPIAGKVSDQRGEKFVILPALIITILALVVLAFAINLFGVIMSAILYGIGFGAAQPALQAVMIRLVSPERTGVANASFSTSTDLGIGLGAMMLGWISQHMNYQILFIVSAISVAFSLLLFFFLTKRLLKSKRVSDLNSESLLSKTN